MRQLSELFVRYQERLIQVFHVNPEYIKEGRKPVLTDKFLARGTEEDISALFPDSPKPLIPIDGKPVPEWEICSLRDRLFLDKLGIRPCG